MIVHLNKKYIKNETETIILYFGNFARRQNTGNIFILATQLFVLQFIIIKLLTFYWLTKTSLFSIEYVHFSTVDYCFLFYFL